MQVIFDIETDSLESSTRIWCIVTRDADTGTLLTSTSLASGHEESLKVLREADCIIGQNIIGFDLPILQQLLAFIPTKKILDTLTLSRLIYPDLRNDDWKRVGFNKELIGSHSLKAWGQRLGLLKDTYGENADWSAWTQEMQDYCEVDTKVTLALYQHLLAQGPAPKAVELELGVARICQRIERAGWHFDRPGADRLTAQLLIKRVDLKEQLVKVFPAKMIQMKTKVKTAVFNPGSRMDIARGLNELYGWQAEEVTPSGQPKIDEAVLSKLPYPEAKLLCEYLLIVKRLGQIGEGEEAWVKLSRNGVIHGRINTNGAVTGRATHSKPNMAQVPASRSPYGKECRSLFGPRPNWVLVGADASGLELRCLSHFLHAYDDGLYCKAVLEGDIHWTNAIAFGVVPAGTKRDKHNADLEEKRNIAERTRGGRMAKLADGGIVGRVPFGYRITGQRKHTRVEIIEERAAIVRRIFALRDSGASFGAIANALNADGVPTPKGAGQWQMVRVWDIIENPAYRGVLRWTEGGRETTMEGVLPAIIPVAPFRADAGRTRARATAAA